MRALAGSSWIQLGAMAPVSSSGKASFGGETDPELERLRGETERRRKGNAATEGSFDFLSMGK